MTRRQMKVTGSLLLLGLVAVVVAQNNSTVALRVLLWRADMSLVLFTAATAALSFLAGFLAGRIGRSKTQ